MLDETPRQEVPLREELAVVRDYLAIARERFGDRLRVSVDAPAELVDVPVPSFILQPLVENAIKHGIAKRAHGGVIRITVVRADERLMLRVENDGPGLRPGWESAATGIGIANIRTRLRNLYGDASRVNMLDGAAGGVVVEVSLPFRAQPQPA
jgi:LytS/YehU family sensor histidine kinase